MSKILLRNQRLNGFIRVLVVALGVLALTCMVFAEITLANTKDGVPFRVGFSLATIGAVNENDAIASIRIWARALVQEINLITDPQPILFNNSSEIKKALILDKLECVNVTTPEYFTLQHLLAKDFTVAAVVDGSIYVEYIVIVNKKNHFEKLADLQGRSLGWGGSPRNSLSLIWLDTALAGKGFNASTDFFKTVSRREKISDIILPVFFGNVDACIVTRKAFEIMVELNPQIGKQMRVVASSPPLVPMIFGFRTNFSSPVQVRAMKAIANWHESPTGRQILTMFQTDSLGIQPMSCLDDTLALLKEHQRLFSDIDSI